MVAAHMEAIMNENEPIDGEKRNSLVIMGLFGCFLLLAVLWFVLVLTANL
jgi:hypothetical protein